MAFSLRLIAYTVRALDTATITLSRWVSAMMHVSVVVMDNATYIIHQACGDVILHSHRCVYNHPSRHILPRPPPVL